MRKDVAIIDQLADQMIDIIKTRVPEEHVANSLLFGLERSAQRIRPLILRGAEEINELDEVACRKLDLITVQIMNAAASALAVLRYSNHPIPDMFMATGETADQDLVTQRWEEIDEGTES